MKPINFVGATHVMGPPKDWNNAVECDPLIVQIEGLWHTSVWKPSPEDIAMLQAGASIVLCVCGGQPPVMLVPQFVEEIPDISDETNAQKDTH